MRDPPGSSWWDMALTFLHLPAAGHTGDTTPLHRDALKQIKPCKVFRNVLVKKLQIGKWEIVITSRLFFSNIISVLQLCMNPREENELETFLLHLVCASSRSSWKSCLCYHAVRNNLWACTFVHKRYSDMGHLAGSCPSEQCSSLCGFFTCQKRGNVLFYTIHWHMY